MWSHGQVTATVDKANRISAVCLHSDSRYGKFNAGDNLALPGPLMQRGKCQTVKLAAKSAKETRTAVPGAHRILDRGWFGWSGGGHERHRLDAGSGCRGSEEYEHWFRSRVKKVEIE